MLFGAVVFSALLPWAQAASPAAAPTPAGVRVAVISDTHTTRDTGEDRVEYRGHFDKVIAAVNAAHVQVVIMTGDLTQFGKDTEFEEFKEQAKGLKSPVFWVPGNHDDGNKKLPPRDPGPKQSQLDECEKELGHTFYVQDVAGLHLIAVNSQLLGSGLPREAEQWKFLEDQFAQPVPATTLVFLHMPPFLNSPDEGADIYWSLDPTSRHRLLDLLVKGGVHTLVTGHLHRPLINQYHGVLIVSCPAVSFAAPRGVNAVGWTLLTVRPDGDVQVEFKPIH